MKIFLGTVLFVAALIAGYVYFGPKSVLGKVVDADGIGIGGLNVDAMQRGFGFNDQGSFVWDESKTYHTTTAENGTFTLNYVIGGPMVNLEVYATDESDPNIIYLKTPFFDQPVMQYNKNTQ